MSTKKKLPKATYRVEVWIPESPGWFDGLALCDIGTTVTFVDVTPKQLKGVVTVASDMDPASHIEVFLEDGLGTLKHLFKGNVENCLGVVLPSRRRRKAA